MTLPLRKKHRTTRPNIAKRLISAGLAALVAVSSAAQTSFVFAADGNWNGQSSSKLGWRPVRPSMSDASIVPAVNASPVRTAKFEQDIFDDAPSGTTRIRLTGGNTTTVRNVAADVFDDNLPSVQSHRSQSDSSRRSSVLTAAPKVDTTRVEPDAYETLPPPITREAPPMLQVDSVPAQREPAELSPPDPVRSGALRHTEPTNQTDLFAPSSPDVPSYNSPLSPQFTPEETCKIAYDKVKAITLKKLSIDITVSGRTGTDVPNECSLTTDAFEPRCWRLTTYTWKASALCHKPLYFEDVALERYGHSHGPVCEYVASFAHFFGDVALLPYHVGVETPCECIYDLGYYRPGNCAPYMLDPFPVSLRGALTAGVGYCGVVALFP
jgi:hypothetical protein